MAQGQSKLKSRAKGRVTKRQLNLRANAHRIIKPKKASAKHAQNLNKLVNALSGTEKLIASRVGHLELLKGTRKELEKEEKEKAKKEKK